MAKSGITKKSSTSKNDSLLDRIYRYLSKYLGNRPDVVEYEEFINEQIHAFDERQQKRLEEHEKIANEPDEDGFVTVVNKRPVLLDETDETSPKAKISKKESKVGSNFYSKNAANQNKNQLEDLRKKFDEDRRRIEELKMSKLLR